MICGVLRVLGEGIRGQGAMPEFGLCRGRVRYLLGMAQGETDTEGREH